MAIGYNAILEETPLWDFSVLAGAGGIRASFRDMMTFLNANLTPDSTPISTTLKLSHEIQFRDTQNKIGFGWMIQDEDPNTVIWHNGQTGGFSSFIAFQPKKKVGFVLLTNTASSVPCIFDFVFDRDCQIPKEYRHLPKDLQSFMGSYELSSDTSIEILQKNTFLVAKISGSKFRLTAVAEGKFELGEGLAILQFLRNPEGNIDRLVFTQGGVDYPAKKRSF
jgi:CubicO group peptidase (beta-lactamase class C family)